MQGRTKLLVKLLALTWAVASPGHVWAAAHPQKGRPKDPFATCMEKVDLSAMKNTQFADCYSGELQRQDGLLNQSFKSLKGRITDPSRVDQMVKAQQSWISFRDRWCAFQESSDQAPSHEVNRLDCLVEMTKSQTKFLSDAEQ